MIKLYSNGYIIMVTPVDNAYMIGQLELEGIYDYLIYRDEHLRFPINDMEKCEQEHEEEYKYKNKILSDLVEKSGRYNLLSDVSDFVQLSKKALKMNKEENLMLNYYGMKGGESIFYGNIQSIIQYAGISEADKKYFPLVSHQGCMLLYTPSFQYKSAVIVQGEYYKRKIHERAPYVPVFSIGPYIHYVEGIYNKEKLLLEKEKIGKMLLIFLPHTIENVERKYNGQDFIDNILQEYNNQFQSIWCCVYWADINKSVCEYAERKGIHVVTAGFRFDSDFNRRLKTILELADAVVVGDIGTFVAYALHMGKPIGRIDISNRETITQRELQSDIERKLQMSDELVYENEFYEVFDKELKNTYDQKYWMNEISGFDQIKNAEYIYKVFEISKDIWQQCKGDLFQYPEAVRQVYYIYDKHLEFDKMAILKSAVGSYIN